MKEEEEKNQNLEFVHNINNSNGNNVEKSNNNVKQIYNHEKENSELILVKHQSDDRMITKE